MSELTETRFENRRLLWEGCVNVRDLGGLPTVDGRRTRVGAFVRAESPSYLTEAGLAALQAYGVRTMVDLRLPEEAREFSYRLVVPGDHGIRYHNLTFIDPALPPTGEIPNLASDYKGMLDRFGHRVLAITRTLADASDGCILFHCQAGKDRTGLVAALLLDLVDVPPEIIAADYALSGDYRRPLTDEWLANGPGSRAEREDWLRRNWPHAEVMSEVLDHLATRYGRAEGYLRTNGLTDAEIQRLRERLV